MDYTINVIDMLTKKVKQIFNNNLELLSSGIAEKL
jgi:hypothetical protein